MGYNNKDTNIKKRFQPDPIVPAIISQVPPVVPQVSPIIPVQSHFTLNSHQAAKGSTCNRVDHPWGPFYHLSWNTLLNEILDRQT